MASLSELFQSLQLPSWCRTLIMGNILAPITIIVGLLLFLKFELTSGRSRTIENQVGSDCIHGECTKREYPWIEAIYKKQHAPFILYSKLDQQRFAQPYLDFFTNSEISNAPLDNIIIENNDKHFSNDPEVMKAYQYQDKNVDFPQAWQDNGNVLIDSNAVNSNSGDTLEDSPNNNSGDTLEDSLNNSQVKRMYHRDRNDLNSFLMLAGLGKNFTLENLKHTRGQTISSDDKYNGADKVNCACRYKKETLDLGNHYYPRLHVTYQCIVNSCPLCQEKKYMILVLKKKEEYDVVNERTNSILPEPLKKDYFFKQHSIPMGCECTT